MLLHRAPLLLLGAVLGTFVLGVICVQWRRSRKKLHPKVSTCPDKNSLEKPPSPPIDGTEDEMQSQVMFPPKVSSEHNTTDGRQGPQMAPPEDTASRFLSREGKQLLTDICDLMLVMFLITSTSTIQIQIIMIISIIIIIVLVILLIIFIINMIISDISQGKENLKQKQHYIV